MDAGFRIKVASPCSARWSEMDGDERARFCQLCSKHVYDLSSMSREDAEALVREREGRETCVRFFVRKDGTAMTADCPVGWRTKVKRRVLIAAGTLVAFFGVFATARAGVKVQDKSVPTALDFWPVKDLVEWIDPTPQPQPMPVIMGKMVCPTPPPPPGSQPILEGGETPAELPIDEPAATDGAQR